MPLDYARTGLNVSPTTKKQESTKAGSSNMFSRVGNDDY